MSQAQLTGSLVGRVTSSDSHNPTTHFANDTLGYEATIPKEVDVDSSITSSLTVPSSQTIIDYLERPAIMSSGVLQTTDSGILFNTDVTTILSNTLKYARLAGIYTVKCGFKVTLQVNASRFQTGRYILGFVPNGGIPATDTVHANLWYTMHTANLTSITQLPHVELDLAKQTHVTLNIPYMSVLTHNVIGASAPYFLMGRVILMPYYGLQAGSGSSTVPYTLWGSCQDVQIGAPTVNQMATPQVKEAASEGVGPISGVLTKVSKASTILGQIPLLAPYTQTASWVSAVFSDAARALGWSKPLDMSVPTRMVRTIAPYMGVADGDSQAKPLGISLTNETAQDIGLARTDVDEMSFEFIKKHYAYFQSFNWTAASTSGTQLFTQSITPNLYTTYAKGFVPLPCNLPLIYTSKWRGGMKYRFKLVKNEFHTGRLLIAFAPGLSTVTFTMAQSEYVYREIVDIRTTSEFEICVPYLDPRLWLGNNDSSGYISIFVLDVLVAPSSVPTTVGIICEACADDDMQYAQPVNSIYEPYIPFVGQMARPFVNQMADPYVVTDCVDLGSTSSGHRKAVEIAIGEDFRSFRQLIKRFFTQQYLTFSNRLIAAQGLLYYWPFVLYPVTQKTNNGAALLRDYFTSDPINTLSCSYLFSSGGMRLMMKFAKGVGDIPFTIEVGYDAGTAAASQAAGGGTYTASTIDNAKVVFCPSNEGVAEVQIPPYNNLLARGCANQIVNGSYSILGSIPYQNANVLTIGNYNDLSGSYSVTLARAGADDFHLHGWVSTVPLVSRNTA
jgi:hypothetical protein